MAAVLVNGLMRMNENGSLKKSGLDAAYIKALIIGICTIKSIENGDSIHKDMLIFMKGICNTI